MSIYGGHKLLVANRGEIAVRILRTAKSLGIRTVAIYTTSDATSPHVDAADEAFQLDAITGLSGKGNLPAPVESSAYLSAERIVSICRDNKVTLVHPGYGFLSENAGFARMVVEAGLTWLGPAPSIIEAMGTKHTARELAKDAGVQTCEGSNGLVTSVEDALETAARVGFPVILKATAGGGGMGMVVCKDEQEIRERFEQACDRAKSLFGDEGVFLEKYLDSARHIEVQIFGDGRGNIVHFGERECSVQRRHQKIIEESPSPFLADKPDIREAICRAAVSLGIRLKYNSAGTVEFIVDDKTGNYYFLEMNTRIQVEHAVTEAIHPGLDVVQLMIDQGLSERGETETPLANGNTLPQRDTGLHAIEVRVYAENPAKGFRPSPGLLQHVDISGQDKHEWLRVDSWVATGTNISTHFDPLLCKIIVTDGTRRGAIGRLQSVLDESKIYGPPNNIEHMKALITSPLFQEGKTTTRFLEQFSFTPKAMEVVASGIEMSIQHLPGRLMGLGMPRSGPMDPIAFQAANILVGNDPSTEALEIIVVPGVGCALLFHTRAVISIAGKSVIAKIDGKYLRMWEAITVEAGKRVEIREQVIVAKRKGFRVYLAVRGGFPEIPEYLGSKSTSMGMGGYQGRNLLPGDQLALGRCEPTKNEPILHLPKEMIPRYPDASGPDTTTIHVLVGPHDSPEFLTPSGIAQFYSSKCTISPSSNRMGIRLECPEGMKIGWARQNGGQGGSHPSNILDNAYAFGSVNVNGDTPVILCNEGPDMGGYVCVCTIASAEMWKIGQLSPGNKIMFRRISWKTANHLRLRNNGWLSAVRIAIRDRSSHSSLYSGVLGREQLNGEDADETESGPGTILGKVEGDGEGKPNVIFRQAGDSDILVEFGPMELDFNIRALVHAFELQVLGMRIDGIERLSPCIRSTMCHFNPSRITQQTLLRRLLCALSHLQQNPHQIVFPSRQITLPIVLDDPWSQEAIERYMKTIRDRAVYVPSNVEYLARNNGLEREELLRKLVETDWLVFGVGFYLGCPFLVPVDPRCRIVGQKMNPSRTYTPRGAIGLAGPVAAIYPVDSPGGYQLYGRTLPAWSTFGLAKGFSPGQPWLLKPFDIVRFRVVSAKAYEEMLQGFDAGRYEFEIKPSEFSMATYTAFVRSITNEVDAFKAKQADGVAREAERENILLDAWEDSKSKAASLSTSQGVTGDGASEAPSQIKRTEKTITSPLHATIYKVKIEIGETIRSASEPVVILESMKTEVCVYPDGEDEDRDEEHVKKVGEGVGTGMVGRKVIAFGGGVKEGAVVKPGDILVVLE